MKFYIIENSRIPQALSLFINIWAITLYPFIICKGKLDQQTKTHEIIHLHQQRELLLIGFYLLYVLAGSTQDNDKVIGYLDIARITSDIEGKTKLAKEVIDTYEKISRE